MEDAFFLLLPVCASADCWSGRERLEGFVPHRAAEAGDAAQQCLPGRTEAVVSRLQNVMLPLDQIAAHVQPRCGGDVAGLLEISHNQAGQQSQAERMVAVRCAGRFNLGARAADALGAEEFHGIGRLHLPEFLLAAALQQSAAFGFQHVRTKPGGQENPGPEIGLQGDVAEKQFGERRDTVAVIAFGRRILTLLVWHRHLDRLRPIRRRREARARIRRARAACRAKRGFAGAPSPHPWRTASAHQVFRALRYCSVSARKLSKLASAS